MLQVIKRDGRKVPFEREKIVNAISKAGFVPDDVKQRIAEDIAGVPWYEITIEQIQDMVETKLMQAGYTSVAREYIRYRYKRELIRNDHLSQSILEIVTHTNEEINEENSNKNSTLYSTQRDYMAGEVSKKLCDDILLPSDVKKAHDEGIIHFHDKDYFAQTMFNCCLVNIEDMLTNGTVISGTLIEPPHSFATACNIMTQIIAQIASNQYGGQSVSLAHIMPFVNKSRMKHRQEVHEMFYEMMQNDEIDKMPSQETINRIAEKRLKKEIQAGVQTIQYQVLTLLTTNGQTPFITVFLYLGEVPEGQERDDFAMVIEEVIKQRYQGVKNEKGVWVTPAFPKIIYVLEEDNIHEDSKYWYLTKMAAQCTAKRMVPDYISEKKMKELKVDAHGVGHCFPVMGCRSALSPYISEKTGKFQAYGRFNQGVVTINLPDVALSALKEWESDKSNPGTTKYDYFWSIFDSRLELCHKALQVRHNHLKGALSDCSPIHFQYGGISRLKKGEPIDELLYGGYSTISLGYGGLYECVYAMTGKSQTDPEAKPFAREIMKYMNEKCDEWKKAENIGYSLYGTPMESTTYKFAKCLKKRFGVVPGVTDHNYITNSYHVPVTEKIDPFTKLKFESEFQELSPGGAISYIETSNLSHNIDAVLEVIQFIYDNIMYAELNTKSDYCQCCGYDGEIQIVDDDNGRLIWKCPNCGNTDQRKMNVSRRTCGYIGTQFWNQGRTEEIRNRYVHLGGSD